VIAVDSGSPTAARDVFGSGFLCGSASGTVGTNDGWGTAAQFNSPNDMTIDPLGIIWLTEYTGGKIRTLDQTGRVLTLSATLNTAMSIDFDFDSGHAFVASQAQNRIYRLHPETYAVSVYAGTSALATTTAPSLPPRSTRPLPPDSPFRVSDARRGE
jgi:hypothetical protein